MDQDVLVKDGRGLVRLFDNAGLPVRAALWAHTRDTDAWRLWIVPHKSLTDKSKFFYKLAALIGENRGQFVMLDPGYVDLMAADHVAIQGLAKAYKIRGGDTRVQSTMLNGFYLPDGIILELDL